jgi:hypothetical protein
LVAFKPHRDVFPGIGYKDGPAPKVRGYYRFVDA